MLKEKKSNSNIIAKVQKGIVISCVLVFVALLVYALIFFTPFYDLINKSACEWAAGGRSGNSYPNWTEAGLTQEQIAALPEECFTWNDAHTRYVSMNMEYFVKCLGSSKTYGSATIQTFNHTLFKMGIVGVLVSLILLVYRTQIRKNFYITNIVVNGLWSVFSVSMAITLFINLAKWQNTVNSINIEIINIQRVANLYKPFDLASTNWIFVLGYIIATFMILAAASLIGLTVYKVLATKKRKEEKTLEKANLAKEAI